MKSEKPARKLIKKPIGESIDESIGKVLEKELERDFEKGELKMDRKKELIMQYKEQKPDAGVYLIRNKVNGKVGVFTTPNMKSLNGENGNSEIRNTHE